jgi:hypothetical protein
VLTVLETSTAINKEFFLGQDLSSALAMSGLTELWLSLHTWDPGEAGVQTTSEVAYTGYGRVAVARQASGWTCSALNASVKNTSGVVWPTCTGGTATARWVGIGNDENGGGALHFRIPIVANSQQWSAGISNIRATAGTTADWVTMAAYANGATTFANDDLIAILPNYEEALPSGLSSATQYYVRTGTKEGTYPDPISFQLSLTVGGAAIDISPADNRCQAFQAIRIAELAIAANTVPTLPTLGMSLFNT